MSFTNMDFSINGVSGNLMGINGCFLVRTDSEIKRPISGSRSVISESIRSRNNPYIYGVDKSNPIEFTLMFSLMEDKFDQQRLFEISKYFIHDKPVEFRSADYNGVVFYVICTSFELVTYGSFQGWVECKLQNIANFAFSEVVDEIYDTTLVTLPYTFTVDAKFNVEHPKYGMYYLPYLEFELLDTNTSFSLRNLSDGNRLVSFTGLNANENIKMYGETKDIKSSSGLTRIDSWNKNWLRLTYGENKLVCESKARFRIKCQYPIYI